MSRTMIRAFAQEGTLETLRLTAKKMGVDSVGKDIHDLWKDVCLSYIQQEHPKNPDLASEMVGAVLFYESEAYRKSGKPPLNHHDTAAYQQQTLELFKNTLSDIAKLGSFDWTPTYDEFRYKYGSHQDTTPNYFWRELQQQGFLPDPQSTLIPQLWQTVFEKGYVCEATMLVSLGFTPKWKGQDNILPDYVIKYDPQDCFLAMVRSEKMFEVLEQIPDNVVQPFINHTNSVGETPLHQAVRYILPRYIERLLKLGADPSAKTSSGKLPMDCLKRSKTRTEAIDDVVALLGAGTKTPNELFVLGARSLSVPLLELAQKKGASIPGLAQTYNVWEIVFDPKTSQTRINTARKRQPVLTQWLLDQGVNPRGATTTALHLAVAHGALECVGVLLDHDRTLATTHDQKKKRPAQKQIEIMPRYSAKIWDSFQKKEEHKILAAGDVAAIYIQKGIDFKIGPYADFPQILDNPALVAKIEKIKLQKAVEGMGANHVRKSKI